MTHSHPTTHHKRPTEWRPRTLAGGEQSSAVVVAVAVVVWGGAYRTLHYAAAMVNTVESSGRSQSTPKTGGSA